MGLSGSRTGQGAARRRCLRLAKLAFIALIAASSLIGGVLMTGACASPTGPKLENGVLATFRVHTEHYNIFITNPQTIEQVLALWNGQSTANIPSGRVRKGRVDYNKAWSWHIDSEDITMAENTIELCDGVPSYVEAHLDDWIATVGYFCPWSAELVALKDYR